MKIEILTTITTSFVVEDTGYTRNMSLPEIEKWGKDRLSNIQILLREGATDPRPVRATFKLEQVIFTPDEEG